MNAADEIRNLIVEGQLEDSLRLAVDFLRHRDAALYAECLQHQGRLNETNRDFRLSIIGMDTVEMARARVRLALVDVVLKRVEELSAIPSSPSGQPAHRQEQQTLVLNFVPNNAPANQPNGQSAAAGPSQNHDHTAALYLVQEFLQLLASHEVENAAWRAAPFLHRSLLDGGMMQPQFKQNNFYAAHQRFRSYKMPVQFAQFKSTNRTAIGSLRDRDEGEEFVYTLEKVDDSGGMPGMVRVFFPKNGGEPKITAVSL